MLAQTHTVDERLVDQVRRVRQNRDIPRSDVVTTPVGPRQNHVRKNVHNQTWQVVHLLQSKDVPENERRGATARLLFVLWRVVTVATGALF